MGFSEGCRFSLVQRSKERLLPDPTQPTPQEILDFDTQDRKESRERARRNTELRKLALATQGDAVPPPSHLALWKRQLIDPSLAQTTLN